MSLPECHEHANSTLGLNVDRKRQTLLDDVTSHVKNFLNTRAINDVRESSEIKPKSNTINSLPMLPSITTRTALSLINSFQSFSVSVHVLTVLRYEGWKRGSDGIGINKRDDYRHRLLLRLLRQRG